MDKGAFNQTALTGEEFVDWLGKNEQMHRVLMKEAGFLAQVSRARAADPAQAPMTQRARRAGDRQRRGAAGPRSASPRLLLAIGAAGDGRQPARRHRLGRRRPALGLLPLLHRPAAARLPAAGSCVQQLLALAQRRAPMFAEREQLALVMAVLVPMVVYVGADRLLGIYVASALLIALLHAAPRPATAGRRRCRWRVGVPLVFFLVFERWFLVPLPKGPLERAARASEAPRWKNSATSMHGFARRADAAEHAASCWSASCWAC